MADIVVIGSLSVDLVTNVIEIPKKDETVIGTSFSQLPGNQGVNQAITMANLGGKVAMVGKIGNDDFGNKLLTEMKSCGINTYYVKKTDNAPTGVSLISVDREGTEAIIVAAGANTKLNPKDINRAEDLINDSKVVLTQLDIPIETVKYGLKIAKEKGKYTILDPTPAQVLDCEIIRHVDLIITNKSKLEILSGIPINNKNALNKASDILLELGVKEIIISKENGSVYINSRNSKEFNYDDISFIDYNKDIFNAALIVKLSQGKTIDEAINYALNKARG